MMNDLYNAFASANPECEPEEIDYMVEQWSLKYDTDWQYIYGDVEMPE